ncbi:proline/glycine betaine ABC transporter permease [Klenkia sp. PcliD-1-E]|uniref:ABC transporter permease n=1 Tax=Klenkia sp. PcliD-1-E TaxID=2954492 RepID=UPI0020968D6E|nr:ABC transporter permease subunit [Klenkia sp. PcliD-1-E]MCO7219963.1 ABC transporter permease subunit [Klenkia sp. PcliD-1-E]
MSELLAATDPGPLDTLPRVPVGEAVETAFDWVTDTFDVVFDAVSAAVEWAVEGLTAGLTAVPALLLAVVLAGVGLAVRSVRFGVGSLLGFALVISMELWPQAMQTLALVLVAAAVATAVAVPVGIAAARSDRVSALVRPVLDFMQTMPAFVYLVPAVVLFSIGLVPGVITTIVFALPPGVRLTELGIRGVDAEVVEAGHAFGSTPGQILRGIQLPLARPTIMAGVNQVIMLALSMSVIAGIVGAPGLGQVVVTGISRLDLAVGFEAGLSVVVLAIWLDRLTAALGGSRRTRRRSRTRAARTPATTP